MRLLLGCVTCGKGSVLSEALQLNLELFLVLAEHGIGDFVSLHADQIHNAYVVLNGNLNRTVGKVVLQGVMLAAAFSKLIDRFVCFQRCLFQFFEGNINLPVGIITEHKEFLVGTIHEFTFVLQTFFGNMDVFGKVDQSGRIQQLKDIPSILIIASVFRLIFFRRILEFSFILC